MAKRFIDTSILPKAFRKLAPSLKLTWFYIWTSCDKAGVWEIDEDLFEFENGIKFKKEEFLTAFEDMVEIKGEKILLKDFLRIDCGELKENYNPHKPYLRAINKNQVKLEPSLNQACFKQGDEDGDGEEDGEEDKKAKKKISKKPPKPKKPDPEPDVIFPFDSNVFKAQWDLWKKYKQKQFGDRYKDSTSEQAALKQLAKKAGNCEKTAIEIIHESMGNTWKGLFPLKNQSNGNRNNNNAKSDSQIKSDVNDAVDQMFGE